MDNELKQRVRISRVVVDKKGNRTETDVTPPGPVSGTWGAPGPALPESDPREIEASKSLNLGRNKPMSVHGPNSTPPTHSMGSGMPGYEPDK